MRGLIYTPTSTWNNFFDYDNIDDIIYHCILIKKIITQPAQKLVVF